MGLEYGYPTPIGIPSLPYGIQGSPELAKATIVIAAWILVIGTDGAAAPIPRPVLLGF